jgi:hypothetical protein
MVGLKHQLNALAVARFFYFIPLAKYLWHGSKIKKTLSLIAKGHLIGVCGEGGIRTPGGVTLNGFQDRRIKPLCHLSRFGSAKIIFHSIIPQ